MNPKLLKRLDALERAVNQTTIPRLSIVDVTDFPDDDRERYWSGDTGIIDRHALTIPGMDPGTITAVIIDLNLACRESWLQTRDMSDEALERHEARRIAAEDKADQEAHRARMTAPPDVVSEPEMRFDQWGYRIRQN